MAAHNPTVSEEVKLCQQLFGMMLVCWNFVHGRLSALQDLSSMYKGFKSLKDIYKDKCNLHVTIPFLEKLRDQRIPL